MEEDIKKRSVGEKATAEERSRAMKLYLYAGMSKGEIAKCMNVSPQAISSWVEKYKWDETKESLVFSPIELHQELAKQGKMLLGGLKTTINLDDMKKIVVMMNMLRPEVCMETASPVLLNFLEFCVRKGLSEKSLAKMKELYMSYMVSLKI